jgi:hypothetical protein
MTISRFLQRGCGDALLCLAIWLGVGCDTVTTTGGDQNSGRPSVEDAAVDAAQAQAPDISLTSVWGAAHDDVWAVGAAGSMYHFDGERWREQERLTDADLTSVHGSGSDDVWAVGVDVVLHWDGTAWSVALQGMSETLLGVWQSAADDVWMVGLAWEPDQGVVRHWNGDKWDWSTLGGVSTLWDVWNSPEGTLWIGGSGFGGSGFLAQAQERELSRASYDGTSLRGIWGCAADDVWVAPYEGALQHWDGSQWVEQLAKPDDARLLGISGSGTRDVWAVGLHGLILHWNGQDWTVADSYTDATLWSVWVAEPDDAWAVGGEILHWDGRAWTTVEVQP